jgi:hypothetical protein
LRPIGARAPGSARYFAWICGPSRGRSGDRATRTSSVDAAPRARARGCRRPSIRTIGATGLLCRHPFGQVRRAGPKDHPTGEGSGVRRRGRRGQPVFGLRRRVNTVPRTRGRPGARLWRRARPGSGARPQPAPQRAEEPVRGPVLGAARPAAGAAVAAGPVVLVGGHAVPTCTRVDDGALRRRCGRLNRYRRRVRALGREGRLEVRNGGHAGGGREDRGPVPAGAAATPPCAGRVPRCRIAHVGSLPFISPLAPSGAVDAQYATCRGKSTIINFEQHS